MKRNQFNPQIYDDKLSTFGKKVLKVMMRQWQTKNATQNQILGKDNLDRSSYHYFASKNSGISHRNKKTLIFLESEKNISPSETLPNDKEGLYSDVPKSTQMINIPNENQKHSVAELKAVSPKSSNEILTSGFLFNKESTKDTPLKIVNTNILSLDSVEKSLSQEFAALFGQADLKPPTALDTDACKIGSKDLLSDSKLPVSFLANKTKECIEFSGDIIWSDMIDTQLIDSQSAAEKKRSNMFPVNSNKDIAINKSKKTIKEQKQLADESLKVSKNSNKTSKIQAIKNKPACKRKAAQITESIPKKVKNIQSLQQIDSKSTGRKQTYTKAVRNWLDSVELEPGNEPGAKKYIEAYDRELKNEKLGYEIQLESIKDQNQKKVVQSKLMNKGGKMKYDKPKHSNNNDLANIEKTDDKIAPVKDKKIKPKFTAPIKSQLPVKEIVYDIYNIDCNSVITHSVDLRVRDSEIFLVLTYSNGFNQLNSQFTEDVCRPEAMMVLINDNLYYLKGKDFNVMKDIAALVKYNTVICYGGKIILKYLMLTFDIDMHEVNVLDTKIGGSLMDPDNPPENFSDLQKLLGMVAQYTIATVCPLQKAAWYMTLLKEFTPRLTTLLKENSLWKVFVEIEMAVMPIIAGMEMRGITVDTEKLNSMENTLLNSMKMTEQECYKAAGKKFQINSTVQVRAILYDELQLDSKCNIKIKETVCQGAKSTSEIMLRSLTAVHPLPKLILDYRQLHKAHATFLVGIAQHVKNGVLKPIWEQTAAATGRIAANNPNIQAIPKAEISINNTYFEDGIQNAAESQQLNFRSIYISRHGFTFLAADFNHVECRVFAHAAGDSSLLELLATGGDLFRVLAAKWLNKPEDSITSEDRERTKRIIYASLYGAGARKLTDILNVSYDQALTVYSSFNRTFPSLKSFGRSVVSRCSVDGGTLATLCGRVRRFANIDSNDAALKAQAERQAVNFIVQGSAADLCKLAMVRTQQRLRAAGVEAHLLLQIHDELVWEIREEHLSTAAGIIKSTMESCGEAAGVGSILPVSLHAGHCWGNMPPYIFQ